MFDVRYDSVLNSSFAAGVVSMPCNQVLNISVLECFPVTHLLAVTPPFGRNPASRTPHSRNIPFSVWGRSRRLPHVLGVSI